MRVMRLAIVLAVLALPARAAPPDVEWSVGGAPWTSASVVTPIAGEEVGLRVAARPGETIRWFEILPDLSRDHHNAEWPWNPGAYEWIGFERVACERVEIEAWRDRATVTLERAVPPPLPASFQEGRAWLRRRHWGTFWLQCEVTGTDGTVRRTHGLESSDARGLSPATLRLSVRSGDAFLGWVHSFANVPSVFGSTPHQSRNWIGADCADVVMVARSSWRAEPVGRDWNVAALVTTLRRRAETELVDGRASSVLLWDRDIRPGDVIAVRYRGGRQYQHVGVLTKDADHDGVLGPADLVTHAGPLPLQVAPLSSGAFDGHVIVLDPG